MNRREHYLEAEDALAKIAEADAQIKEALADGSLTDEQLKAINAGMEYAVQIAQVHATLAQVPARWIAGEDYSDQTEGALAQHPDVHPDGDTRGSGMGILHPEATS
jgi:hypothetical protein